MVLNRNYRVTYIEVGSVDITQFVVSLDDLVLQNNGKLSTAKFTLNAEYGQFLTDTNGGTTPILKQFDRIEIVIIDDDGFDVASKVFELTTDLTQLTKLTSYFLPLELESTERNAKGIAFSGFFRDPPVNFHDMIDKIVVAYDNSASTIEQPLMTTTFMAIDQNQAPKFNPQIWDFTNIDNCYDALMFVIDQMNLPVSAGGAGGRFAINFIDNPLVPNVIVVRVLKQGNNNPGSIPTLQQNTAHPIMKIDKIKMPSTGTQVIARGRAKTGHLYTEYDFFVSRLEFYRAIPFYDEDVVYEIGIPVRVGTQRYEAILQVPTSTPPPNATFWKTIDVGDYVGLIDYSPVTKNKLNEFKNGLGKPEGPITTTDFDGTAIPDANVVINDRSPTDVTLGTFRSFPLMRIVDDDVSADAFKREYTWQASGKPWIEGTIVLLDLSLGALAGFFAADNYGNGAGIDLNNRPYANSVVQYTERSNESGLGYDWIVIRVVEDFDQVAVWSERRTYEWNVDFATVDNRNYPGGDRRRGTAPGPMGWRDITDQFLGNDCFHAPVSITQVDGLFADVIEDDEPLNDPNGDPYIENSGIKIEFGYNALGLSGPYESVWKTLFHVVAAAFFVTTLLVALTAAVFSKFITPDYTTMGWWYVIPSPNALSTHNGVADIGQVYGGDINTIDLHRYFDLYNSTRTVKGFTGYNDADSDTLMEVTGFTLLLQFDITSGGVRVPFTGNLPFTHWALTKDGQMWKSPKKFLRKLGETDRLTFEYGDLAPAYYARTPLGIDNIIENILVPEIQRNRVLLKENIILQGLQLEIPYDQHGRYSINLYEQVIKPVFFNFFQGGTDDIRFSGIVDAVNWIKTPIAISKFDQTATKRIINPAVKDYPNIVNIEQLQRYADAQEQVEVFQYQQWTVEQGGIGDLPLEDSVFLFDADMVNDSDDGPNTIQLTVREIHFSVPKDKGLTRKLVLVKVIT